jgi:GNAT superfamily N-acetyltransferase
MLVDIVEEDASSLAAYAAVPIRFQVLSVVEAHRPEAGGEFLLEERRVSAPFEKDYDAVPGNSPVEWPTRFDVSSWGFLVARSGGVRVGGATVLIPPTDADLAVLWDIRVDPAARGQGVGSALINAAEQWAGRHGAHRLQVETQNINVPACRFYAHHSFTLEAVNHFAYANLPGEIQFLWYKNVATA